MSTNSLGRRGDRPAQTRGHANANRRNPLNLPIADTGKRSRVRVSKYIYTLVADISSMKYVCSLFTYSKYEFYIKILLTICRCRWMKITQIEPTNANTLTYFYAERETNCCLLILVSPAGVRRGATRSKLCNIHIHIE